MPTPDTPLAARLRARIAAAGPLAFADFMAAALYDPEHGYYASGRAAIGRGGDFLTSVSVGPLFGRLLARQFGEMWRRLGAPDIFEIVEQGAHRGDFARDALTALRAEDAECFVATRYRIVEPAGVQRTAQQEALAEFSASVSWHDDLASLEPVTGVHFSNELLDAMPVHLVIRCGEGWRERCVGAVGEAFQFVDRPVKDAALDEQLAKLPPLPEGFVVEVNLAALAWMEQVARTLARGWVLALDYGFPRAQLYSVERPAGTLRGYSGHKLLADPLHAPGTIDLTAHVDFTSLAERAADCGLQPAGFTDQHHFMVGLGALHFRDGVIPDAAELRAFQTLMHPTLMGTTFKVIAFSRGVDPEAEPLAGFRFARARAAI